MPRWLTFDSRTASRLRQQLKGDHVFEHGAAGAVEYAVNVVTTTVAVIPTEVPGQAAVAVIRPVAIPRAAAVSAQRLPERKRSIPEFENNYQAGGILGLRDEQVYEDEARREIKKKNWWQRFWDES